jgi:class 3 adenylate cyclase
VPEGPGEACARIRGHLAQGAPWDACDAFRAAVIAHPAHSELLYCGALAHARAGAAREAHALLDRAQAAAPTTQALLADILSLRGRLWKDQLHRRPDAGDAAAFAHRARDEYLAAWSLSHDPYPGINAASLSLLLGDHAATRELARAVNARIEAQPPPRAVWDEVTLGEAALLLGQPERARECYVAALTAAAGDAGSVATMRRQLLLLARVLPDAAALLPVVRAADVVAFTGHLVDAPGRAVPRFPPELVPAVEAAVRERLAGLRRPVFYGSAACGVDLIVLEGALALGAEVNVVLPFARQDFVRTSVAVAGDDWIRRFDAVLARAARIIFATDEPYLGDDVLFNYAAQLVEGMAVLRAEQLQSSPRLLCVFDEDADSGVGGTQSSYDRWRRRGGTLDRIDLAALRSGAALPAPEAVAPVVASAAPEPIGPESPPRMIKTLVFADFAGYSRLHDVNATRFQNEFWAIAARRIASSATSPLFANTWGDGLFLVFEAPRDGASFALGLSADMQAIDWTTLGLPDASQIRICVHAGPVFRAFDPVIARDNYFGSSVTRAARIEPVTPPGTVFASEAFAATLAAAGHDDFLLEYVGWVGLAKGFGESRVYRLASR